MILRANPAQKNPQSDAPGLELLGVGLQLGDVALGLFRLWWRCWSHPVTTQAADRRQEVGAIWSNGGKAVFRWWKMALKEFCSGKSSFFLQTVNLLFRLSSVDLLRPCTGPKLGLSL